SYKMIADDLFISEETVRRHIKNIYRKLEVHSKSEAVAKAFKEKLVNL
ncbi:MAG: response regulator transcription factor, partial [Calditrichaeota bacterium]|nr:response regulator transcription factor [Calditrichota bacterium]